MKIELIFIVLVCLCINNLNAHDKKNMFADYLQEVTVLQHTKEGDTAKDLTVVVVTGNVVSRYKTDNISPSLRLNEPLQEIPQNIQIISATTFKDQQIISMSDGVARNVSGAVRQEHWGDTYTRINMRGSSLPTFRNGMNVVVSPWSPLTEDISFVDHIEFVKGPAGFVLANGDPSGMYNVVTKKPTGTTKGEATLIMGSWDLYRASIDLDGKISNNGKLLYRLNIAAQNKKSFRPNEHNDRYSIAPVISYQIDAKTKITAEYTFQFASMSNIGSYYVFSPKGYGALPKDFTLLPPNIDPTLIRDHSAFLNLEHKFNNSWKITSQMGYFNSFNDGSSMWPDKEINPDGTLIRKVSISNTKGKMTLGQVFLNGNIQTGGIQHRILAGVDVGTKLFLADWKQSYTLDLATKPFNPLNPVNTMPANGYPAFDKTLSLETRAYNANAVYSTDYAGIYVQDELGFFNNRVRLTLAGRYTQAKSVSYGTPTQPAFMFTPRVGLSASVTKNIAFYVLYDQAFIPQAGIVQGGGVASPITGSNIELGIKKDFFEGKWNITASIYRITKRNELTTDPTAPPNTLEKIVIGEKIAQGFDFDLKGEISSGLNLILNYAYTDAKVTAVHENVKTLAVGDRLPGANKHTINGWLTYTIQKGVCKGLGGSGGFTYYGDRSNNWSGAYNPNVQQLPNYFKLDAGIFYEKDKIKFAVNIFNLLDAYLYSGNYSTTLKAYSYQVDPPRNFRFSVTYSF